jgi:rhamnose transport system ATP-binding protein
VPDDLVRLVGVTKRFGAITAVDDVTLELGTGIHALVGENGAGKSTIVRLLSGVLQPDAGEVVVGARRGVPSPRAAIDHGIATIFQDRALVQQLTVAQNIGLGLEHEVGRLIVGRRAQRRVAEEALALVDLDIDPDAPIDRLSVGDQQLVAIAKALRQDARLLILDEPTAALTGYEADRLTRLLRGFGDRGIAILYISHRLAEVTALADRVTVLKDGVVQATLPVAEAPVPVMMRHMIGRELGDLFPPRSKPGGAVVMQVHEATAADGGFRDVSFELRAGEILGIAGLEGSGKEDLADALGGGRSLAAGSISVHGKPVRPGSVGRMLRAGVAYIPPDRRHQALFGNLSVTESITLASLGDYIHFGLIRPGRERASATDLSSRVGIRGDIAGSAFGLSGGNQQKAVLARALCCQPDVLVLAEPTAGVDVGAKAEIYRILAGLAQKGAAMVIVSSEMTELLGCCHRILVLRDGAVSAELAGEVATEEDVLRAQLPVSSGSSLTKEIHT